MSSWIDCDRHLSIGGSLLTMTMQLFVVLYNVKAKNVSKYMCEDWINFCMCVFTFFRSSSLYLNGTYLTDPIYAMDSMYSHADMMQDDFDTVQKGLVYLFCMYWFVVSGRFCVGMEWKNICRIIVVFKWVYLFDPLNKNSGLWDE